jgi:hypothetical protein
MIIGRLIRQAGDVRQQVTDCHIVSSIAREFGQKLLRGIIELQPPDNRRPARSAVALRS